MLVNHDSIDVLAQAWLVFNVSFVIHASNKVLLIGAPNGLSTPNKSVWSCFCKKYMTAVLPLEGFHTTAIGQGQPSGAQNGKCSSCSQPGIVSSPEKRVG